MWKRKGLAVAGAGALLSLGVAVPADATPPTAMVVEVGCGAGSVTSINDAVSAVAPGGVVKVCAGTYSEDVVVSKPVTIQGPSTAIVDPGTADPPIDPGLGNNAFTVVSPRVTINGFTVQNATGDGVFVLGDHAVIENVTALGNANDGINVDGSSWSTIANNTVTGNNGGIELANDPAAFGLPLPPGVTGTASHDSVLGNHVIGNPNACGIFLVDHGGGGNANGIHDNVVRGNEIRNNALDGFGAGILLATGAPMGAVYNNLVESNVVVGNGLAGVTVHSHIPSQNFSGNVITGNDIGTNNVRGFEEPSDPQTTGIFIGSFDRLNITVSNNTIHDNTYGVFATDNVKATGALSNTFTGVTTPLGSGPYLG